MHYENESFVRILFILLSTFALVLVISLFSFDQFHRNKLLSGKLASIKYILICSKNKPQRKYWWIKRCSMKVIWKHYYGRIVIQTSFIFEIKWKEMFFFGYWNVNTAHCVIPINLHLENKLTVFCSLQIIHDIFFSLNLFI